MCGSCQAAEAGRLHCARGSAAGSMLTVIPIMIIYSFASRYFIRGIALTGWEGLTERLPQVLPFRWPLQAQTTAPFSWHLHSQERITYAHNRW